MAEKEITFFESMFLKRMIIACVFCAIAGASAGYVGGKWFLPYNEAEQEEVAERKSGSMKGRFTVAGNDRNSIPGGSSGQPLVMDDRSLNLLMKLRRGNMTPDQLKDEIRVLIEEMKEKKNRSYRYYDEERNMLLRELGRQWGLSAPYQALAVLKKDQTGSESWNRNALIYSILNGWAVRDPEAAAQYYLENREEMLFGGPSCYLQEWAKTDPEGAWRNLKSLSKYEQDSGVYSFFSSIFETEPGKAGEFISKLDKSQWENDYLLSYFASQWNQLDKEGMDKWMEGLPFEQQDKLKPFTVMNMVDKSPEEAGKALSVLSAEDQERALTCMGWKLHNNMDPRESIEWLSEYATEDVVARQAPQFIREFERESAKNLYAWLKELPEGQLRENVLSQYSRMDGSKEVDYSARLELLQTIKDDNKRDSVLQSYFKRWAEKNPEESRKWLESAPVPESMKNNLMSIANRNIESQNTTIYKE